MNQFEILDPIVDLKNKLYQRTIWPKVSRVAAGEMLSAPFLVEIDPTTFCDMSCPECLSRDILNSTRFTSERLVEIVNELVAMGVNAVLFVGGGEPLAHPAISQAIEVCGRGGMKVAVVTNGNQLHKYTSVLVRYAEWVRVSVDAATPETFRRFRPHVSEKDVFNKIITNMINLKKSGMKTLGFSFLLISRKSGNHIIDSNFPDLYRAGVLAKSIGCDYFEVKPLFDPETQIVYDQPDELILQLQRDLDRLRMIEDSSFKVILAQALIELIDGKFMAKLYDYGKCHLAELRSLITSSGMYLCYMFRGKPLYSFGDPINESIFDIWNSSRRIELINSIKPYKDCLPKCPRHLSNIDVDLIGKGLIKASLVNDFDFFI